LASIGIWPIGTWPIGIWFIGIWPIGIWLTGIWPIGVDASPLRVGLSGISVGIEPGPTFEWSVGIAPDFPVIPPVLDACASELAPAPFDLIVFAGFFFGVAFLTVFFCAFCAGIVMPGMFIGMDWANDEPATVTNAAARKRGNNGCSFVLAQRRAANP
jgi:hypothetical protein